MKKQFRQSILKKRISLNKTSYKKRSKRIQENFLAAFPIQTFKTIGLYMPFNNEVDLELLIKENQDYKNTITFPLTKPGGCLEFIAPPDGCDFRLNQFGILEPTSGKAVAPAQHDAMIIPAIGADKNGCRIGFGGGYYDRTFHILKDSICKPILIGLLFEFQMINKGIGEPHDIKFDYIFSESSEN